MGHSIDVYMSLYTGDFLKDVQAFDVSEVGGYTLLLIHYWNQACEVEYNEASLIKVCRFPNGKKGKEKLKNILKCFKKVDGMLVHERVKEVFDKSLKVHESHVAKGKKGAAAKKDKQVSSTQAEGEPQLSINQHQLHLQKNKKQNKSKNSKTLGDESAALLKKLEKENGL